MTINKSSFFLRLAGFVLIVIVIGSLSSAAQAQPVLEAKNTALGGGGTTYLTGFESTFWNPANLAINDRHGQIHLGTGTIGVAYDPVLSSEAADDQFFNFTDSYFPHKTSTTSITPTQRNDILDNNYSQDALTSEHQTRADLILGGISWQHNDKAFAVALRSRFASKNVVGRGWYSEEFVLEDELQYRDFTLKQQVNQLLELSAGYGQHFTFIDGLFAQLSELYIGIAPKVVLAGPSFNAEYDARYVQSEESSDVFISDFSYRSTGKYSRMTSHYLLNGNPQSAIDTHLSRTLNLLDNTGYGMGFDFGLTYLIPIDLAVIEDDPEKSVISQSIRFSFSANDIGMIFYNDDPLELSVAPDTIRISNEPVKESMFIGSGGQYLSYFDDASVLPNPLIQSQNNNLSNYSVLLPASLNAGMLVDLSRVKVSGDLTLGLKNTAFTNTKLAIHLGLEARPLETIPVRLGTRLAANTPTYLGMGTGFETRYWDFNIGTQFILRSRTFTSELAGGAFAGIQLHL